MRKSDSETAATLSALIHGSLEPLSSALLHVQMSMRALRRLSRTYKALAWLARSLETGASAEQELRARTLQKALSTLGPMAADVSANISEDLRVLAAPGALETVLENLIRNAAKHAHDKAPHIVARTLDPTAKPWPASAQIQLQGPKVLLTVSDRGPGIPPRLRPRLFKPFVRGTEEHSGMGIGLWLSRLLVQAHGGDLWLDETARGASFSSLWPLAPNQSSR